MTPLHPIDAVAAFVLARGPAPAPAVTPSQRGEWHKTIQTGRFA